MFDESADWRDSRDKSVAPTAEWMGRRIAVLALTALAACASAPPDSPKIAIDLANVNELGLRGRETGLRAVHYEFCIPPEERHAAEVRKIDATAQLLPGIRGRIGCSGGQVLVLGNTLQRGYRQVLERLAALPYVSRIQEAHFE